MLTLTSPLPLCSGPVNEIARYHYFQSFDFTGMGLDHAMRWAFPTSATSLRSNSETSSVDPSLLLDRADTLRPSSTL
jgi:hypothetical protein